MKRKEIVTERRGECLVVISHARDFSCHHGGYIVVRKGGRLVRLHRLIYEENFGPIPSGMFVLHTCGNSACVEPSHLKLGHHYTEIRKPAR